jgi:flagellar biosynthesis chaperone FliJ
MTVPDYFGLHVKKASEAQIEAAAKQAYLNNRAGRTSWENLDERHKKDWRTKVKPVVEAALNAR